MFGRLMPQEGKFFEFFNAHAEQIVQGGAELAKLMAALLHSPEQARVHQQAIDVFETRADKITHETLAMLHMTFITPIDRDDIHKLINSMDDILDTIQDVAESLTLYDVRRMTPDGKQLADLCTSATQCVKSAVSLLSNMDNAHAILKTCQEIDQLESDADRVMRAAMSKLFREEQDVRQLIKLKAVYELLETVTDRCEDVANVIEGIVLENS